MPSVIVYIYIRTDGKNICMFFAVYACFFLILFASFSGYSYASTILETFSLAQRTVERFHEMLRNMLRNVFVGMLRCLGSDMAVPASTHDGVLN